MWLLGVSIVSRTQCSKKRGSFKMIGRSFHGFQNNAQRREVHSRWLVRASMVSRRQCPKWLYDSRTMAACGWLEWSVRVSMVSRTQCSKKRGSFKMIGRSFHGFQNNAQRREIHSRWLVRASMVSRRQWPQMTLWFKNNGCLWLAWMLG